MKKYPISKKAIAVAIVTTMAITPFATLAPLAGDSSTVYADEVSVASYATVDDVVNRINQIYTNFQQNNNNVNAQVTVNQIRADVAEASDLDWIAVANSIGVDSVTLMETTPGVEAGFVAEFIEAAANIFVVSRDRDQLLVNVNAFIDEYDEQFKALFPELQLRDLFMIIGDVERNVQQNPPTPEQVNRAGLQQYFEQRLEAVRRTNTQLNYMLTRLEQTYSVSKSDLLNIPTAVRDNIVVTPTETELNTLAFRLFVAANATPRNPNLGDNGGFIPPVDPEDPEEPVDPEEPIDEEEVTVPDDTTEEERVTDPETGQVTVITTVNAELLAELLDGEEFDRVTFNLTPADGEYAILRLSDDVLDVIRAANPDAIIEVVTPEGSFAIPVSELDYTSVDISVNEVDYDASQNQVTPVAPVVEFLVVATINGQEVEITRFDAPVERTIVANDDLSNNAVVVRLNTNGTITGVATKRDGDTATFTGFTNSLYTVVENSVSYSDVPSSLWSSEVINKLSTQYILRGFSSGDFRPTGTASRAEFAAIISRGLSLTGGSTYMGQFTDVVGNEWYMGDLVAVTDYDLIRGYENNTFRGNNEVTRQEAATIIVRAMELLGYDFDLDESVSYTDFNDSADVAPYARESVTILSQAGLIEGRPGNNFAPRANISRQEVAALVERFLVKADFLD